MAERIVITGASRGIGLELVRQHAARGDRVLATCRRPERSQALTSLAKTHRQSIDIAQLDVTDETSITKAMEVAGEKLGNIDLLWSVAGVYPGMPGTDVEEEGLGTLKLDDGLSVLAVNAVGPLLVAQAFLPLLRRSSRPRLAVLSSGYGSVSENRGTPYWYGASKAALNMLHRSFAFEPAARGITVLLLSPGWVQTDMGGPGAPTTVSDSVDGLMRVVDEAKPEQNGSFMSWKGTVIPW